ncbi:solute carrier family 22 member 1-like [Aricia agestis]|uniref:solute carrier family 22 member 1-like n=1 Tax=Aricia agestis TaxID=91739 RepID=UPI001C203584|nr:solute carrier family 22 member 1-like [Aricia agestis]
MTEQMEGTEKKEPFNLDGILNEIGSFGRYQIILITLLCLRDSFLYMCSLNFVFAAADVSFRCNDNIISTSSNGTLSSDSVCPCQDIVYDSYDSIVAEFNLGCDPWKQTLIGTVHNAGLMLSIIVTGYLSDRYGRKNMVIFSTLTVAIPGLLKTFVYNYWLLLFFELLESALGYSNSSIVLSLETVSEKKRVKFLCVTDIVSTLGGSLFGVISWKVPYWRHMLMIIYAPLLAVVFYQYIMDEGVRWLLSQNRNEEAVDILKKVATINNVTLSNASVESLHTIAKESIDQSNYKVQSSVEKTPIISALKSKKILLRICLIAACLFCCMFVNMGTSIYAVNINGNKYVNFTAVMLASIPTRIVTAFTLDKFGRRAPICVAYGLSVVTFVASVFVSKSIWWASLVLYLLGKMCSSYGIFAVCVVAMEIFPTTSRNSLTNIAMSFGRLGSVLSPQAPLLEKYMPGLPCVVFGLAAVGPVVLAFSLPETTHQQLPQQIKDAENIDKNNVKQSVSA